MNPINYISLGITLLVMGFNVALFIVLKFNDLKHLSKDVSEIKEDVKTLVKKDEELGLKVAKMEVRCQERHHRSTKTKL